MVLGDLRWYRSSLEAEIAGGPGMAKMVCVLGGSREVEDPRRAEMVVCPWCRWFQECQVVGSPRRLRYLVVLEGLIWYVTREGQGNS